MPDIEPYDDAPDAASPPSAAPAQTTPLIDVDDDPRVTLARILQHLVDAFGADAGTPVDGMLAQLALSLTRFLHGPYPLRATIIGPTGAGKTRLLNLLASIMQLPTVVIPITDISETGWRGAQLSEVCRMLHPSLFRYDELTRRVRVPTGLVALPSIVMLDEIDKVALVHDGVRLEGSAAAARIGKQHSLMPLVDPESEMVVQYDDASIPFRFTLRHSIVLCCGAFSMAPANRPITPTDLVDVGLTRELVDRMGSVWMLPTPGAMRRATIARMALSDVEAFALRLGVTVTGIDAFVAAQPAPDLSPDYIGLRGLLHFVTQRVLSAVADALTQQRTHIDLMESRGDV